VTLDNVVLVGATVPPLAVTLDPAGDSGVPGDGLTSAAAVTLVGTTNPAQQVMLDRDGDGS
jgi:hypothetical protein